MEWVSHTFSPVSVAERGTKDVIASLLVSQVFKLGISAVLEHRLVEPCPALTGSILGDLSRSSALWGIL